MRLFLLAILFNACASFTEAQTVYLTQTGKKYHKENCRYLRLSKSSTLLSEALDLNYEACKVCKPPLTAVRTKVQTDTSTVKPKVKPKLNKKPPKQCKAITKSTGRQCKRMTNSTSGKCWQHE